VNQASNTSQGLTLLF